MYLMTSWDDLEDAIERCQETAKAFPELGSSHEDLARLEDPDEALELLIQVSAYLNPRENTSAYIHLMNGHHYVRVLYTLTADEYDEGMEALEDYLEDADEEEFHDIPPITQEELDTAYRLLAAFEEDLKNLKRKLEEDDVE